MSFDLKTSQSKQPAKYQEEWDAKSAQYDIEQEENIDGRITPTQIPNRNKDAKTTENLK